MSFTFDWAVLRSANGSVVLDDAGRSAVLTVTSDPAISYRSLYGGNLFASFLQEPMMTEVQFTNPIKNASFEILDLDSDETSYDDRVTVNAFDRNGVAVQVVFSQLEPYHIRTGNSVEANGNSSTSVDGPGAADSITVGFGGPVTRIEVSFSNGGGVTNSGAIGFADISGEIVCFAAGTRILGDAGEVAVEDLIVGDPVMTRDHGIQPVRWIGGRKVRAQGRFAPIRITAGVLGNARDLWLSPQHRVLLTGWQAELLFGTEEVLVAAKHLLSLPGVDRMEGGWVRYFHILFDAHEIVFAAGTPCESFHPGTASLRGMDDAPRSELFALFPALAAGNYGQAVNQSLKRHEGELLAGAL